MARERRTLSLSGSVTETDKEQATTVSKENDEVKNGLLWTISPKETALSEQSVASGLLFPQSPNETILSEQSVASGSLFSSQSLKEITLSEQSVASGFFSTKSAPKETPPSNQPVESGCFSTQNTKKGAISSDHPVDRALAWYRTEKEDSFTSESQLMGKTGTAKPSSSLEDTDAQLLVEGRSDWRGGGTLFGSQPKKKNTKETEESATSSSVIATLEEKLSLQSAKAFSENETSQKMTQKRLEK